MLRFPGTHGTEIHIQLIETSACKPTRSNRRPHPAGAHQRVAFRWIEVAIAFVELPDLDMLRALDFSLCPFVRVPHIEQRPGFARARKAALDFLGPDHRDRLHRLALRSSGDNTDISACDTVERDSYEMRHGSFELVFVRCDKSQAFPFADKPSRESRDHADRKIHRSGQMSRKSHV